MSVDSRIMVEVLIVPYFVCCIRAERSQNGGGTAVSVIFSTPCPQTIKNLSKEGKTFCHSSSTDCKVSPHHSVNRLSMTQCYCHIYVVDELHICIMALLYWPKPLSVCAVSF